MFPTFWLGRALFDRRTGAIAAAGVALHWARASEASVLFSEVLYTPLLLCAVLLLLRALEEARIERALLAGLLMGLVTLVRPTTVGISVAVLVVGVALQGWRRSASTALAFGAGMLLLLAPWSLRNSVVHDVRVVLEHRRHVLRQPPRLRLARRGRT